MITKSILVTALLALQTDAIQISQAIQKQRSQLEWRQEATNKFSWNATQELKWSVVNAFTDVQTSPDGDVYAIQKISSEISATRYQLYLYNISSSIWSLVNTSFDVKAVRFDRLGNMYYLDSDNCVRNQLQEKLICGLSDFEVTVQKEIIGLNDGQGVLSSDTVSSSYKSAFVSPYKYKALTGYKGITLLKDEPILIQNDGSVDARYGGEKVVSISAGIDGSLWALQQEANVTDFTLLKWQTVSQKWYKVEGAKGASISAYNEISVALVNSIGLLSLSSQVGHQNEAEYVVSEPNQNNPTTTEPQIIINSQQFQSLLANSQDFKWITSLIQGKNFTKMTQIFGANADQMTMQEGIDTFSNKNDIIVLYKTNYNAITGFYVNGTTPSRDNTGDRRVDSVVFSLSQKESFPFDQTRFSNMNYNYWWRNYFTLDGKFIQLRFVARCGKDQDGNNTDEMYVYERDQISDGLVTLISPVLLTGNTNNPNSVNVSCQRIEYYLAK
ncbi:UNKNOWN [Stylonychia lemnae]|uniref:TLDc domain-containing protein n=1 Tax=Stylonychia lemnae TaxID=5949 RepID=A0A078B5H0_STYLE|nr:UNKNOWN [Stylonychia lemnae]|eukprot:CDW89441.1 UNKNOWN [Stylonychia lemnae]